MKKIRGASPLVEAESQCLEVLLTKYSLYRESNGALGLEVRINDKTPTILHRKDTLQDALEKLAGKLRASSSAPPTASDPIQP